MRISYFFLVVLLNTSGQTMAAQSKFTLQSSAFTHDNFIPREYSCDHHPQDISPELHWENPPQNTQSFALIVDDPDAPAGVYTHWVAFNIPQAVRSMPRHVPQVSTLSNGIHQGTNSAQSIGYVSPCPPSGTHRYNFKLYALDTVLDLEPGITKQELETAMRNHILGQTELIGLYKRS